MYGFAVMFDSYLVGCRCGKKVIVAYEQYGPCPGTMCPVDKDHTIWICSSCGNRVEEKKGDPNAREVAV